MKKNAATLTPIEFTPAELLRLAACAERAAGAISEIHALLATVGERNKIVWMGSQQTVHEIVDELTIDIDRLASARAFVQAKFGTPENWEKE